MIATVLTGLAGPSGATGWLGAADLAGRVVVAGAFALAAVLKLADLPGLRATLYLSRLTRPWVPQLSALLPGGELALAVALPGTRLAWPAAMASAALLLAFTAYLAADRTAGEGCTCFGRRSDSSRTSGIVRDVLLLAALLPALARGPAGARWGVPAPADVAFLLVGVVAIVAGVALALRRDSASRGPGGGSGRRRAGVPPRPAPVVRREAVPFDLPALDGGRLRLDDVLPPRTGGALPARATVVLLFVEPGCALCEALLPEVAGRADVVVIAAGAVADVEALALRYGLDPAGVAVDADGAVGDAYGLTATPGACRLTAEGVLVDAQGHPTDRLSYGTDAVQALLDAILPG